MSAEATRARLLEAAIAAIDAGGESAVSVDDIAKTAGVTAPTIYNYFRNRDGLVTAAQVVRFDRQLDEDFASLASVIDTIHTREQFIEVTGWILATFSDPARSNLRMRRMSAFASAVGRPELTAQVIERFTALCSSLADVIRPMQERGVVRPDLDLVAFSAWFTGSVTGRLFIELGDSPIDAAAWDRIFLEAVTAVTLAPEHD